MDRIEFYKSLIRQVICDYAALLPRIERIEQKIIFHEETAYYALMEVGWLEHRRIYGNIIHCEIKNDKIWMYHDGTEDGIVDFFLENGVPKTDIVLGFRAPEMRQYTDFAVA